MTVLLFSVSICLFFLSVCPSVRLPRSLILSILFRLFSCLTKLFSYFAVVVPLGLICLFRKESYTTDCACLLVILALLKGIVYIMFVCQSCCLSLNLCLAGCFVTCLCLRGSLFDFFSYFILWQRLNRQKILPLYYRVAAITILIIS